MDRMNRRKRLGEMLIEAGVIDEFQLSAALTDQRRWGNRLGSSLIRLGFLDEKTLTRCLAKQYGIPGIDLDKVTPQPEALATLPREVARRRLALPMAFKKGEGGRTVLLVALGDPQNLESLDEIRFATNHPLQIRLASDHAIMRAIDRFYFGKQEAERAADSSAIHEEAPDAPMVLIRGVDEELAESERLRACAGEAGTDAAPAPQAAAPTPEVAAPMPEVAAPAGEAAAPAPEGRAEVRATLRALVRLLVRHGIISLEELRAELRTR